MVALIGIRHRFSSHLGLACQSLTPLRGAKAKLATSLMFKNGMCHILVMHLQQGNLTLALDMRVVGMAGNYLFMEQEVQQVLRRKEDGGWHM